MNQSQNSHAAHLDHLLKPLAYVRESAWFVLQGKHRYGPIPFVEMVRLMQNKTLQPTDYVWRPEIKTWTRVSELPEFSPDTLRALLLAPDWRDKGVFSQRQFSRFAYGTSVIAHNSQHLFRGRSMEMSIGGAGLLIDRSDLSPGTDLILHFKPGTDLPAFNAAGKITSRLILRTQGLPEQFKYGFKFESLDSQAFGTLVDYLSRKSAA